MWSKMGNLSFLNKANTPLLQYSDRAEAMILVSITG
jgi:hypothetical protein